jgi:Fic-DOC domain mobile mystery protein B
MNNERSTFCDDDEANTPLDTEEREQLVPSYIALRRELNEAEQVNIAAAAKWLGTQKRDVLSDAFLRTLHKRMFGEVWRWAGQYRSTAKNLGVDARRVPIAVAQLVDDAKFWSKHNTYGKDEIAVRFGHRLVAIHPFPNGNGRLSRMATDLLAVQLARPRFSWGSASLVDSRQTRRTYIEALRAANAHDYEPLLAFARS